MVGWGPSSFLPSPFWDRGALVACAVVQVPGCIFQADLPTIGTGAHGQATKPPCQLQRTSQLPGLSRARGPCVGQLTFTLTYRGSESHVAKKSALATDFFCGSRRRPAIRCSRPIARRVYSNKFSMWYPSSHWMEHSPGVCWAIPKRSMVLNRWLQSGSPIAVALMSLLPSSRISLVT